MNWFIAHLDTILAVASILLAAGYAYVKGTLLTLVGQVWGVITGMAKEVLAAIPEADFARWAEMIYDALPALVKVFVSADWIKTTLMKWCGLLVARSDQKVSIAMKQSYLDVRPSITRAVALYLRPLT